MKKMKSRDIYKMIIKKKHKKHKGQTLQREQQLEQMMLTPKEREYWFKVRHGWMNYRKQTSFFVEEQRRQTCVMCGRGKEDRKHFEGGCEALHDFLKETSVVDLNRMGSRRVCSGPWYPLSGLDIQNRDRGQLRELWMLEGDRLPISKAESIAKLGYAWYEERNKLLRPTRQRRPDYTRIWKLWKRSMEDARQGRSGGRSRGGRGGR